MVERSDQRTDMLSFLPTERLCALRPFSNVTEYCLGDRRAALSFLRGHGQPDDSLCGSDYDLFALLWAELEANKNSITAKNIRRAVRGLLGCDTDLMNAETVWRLAADKLDTMGGEDAFSFDLDRLGVAVRYGEPTPPAKLGKTELFPVMCPLGTEGIDPSAAVKNAEFDRIDELWAGMDHLALFFDRFVFEEPNEYTARLAWKKLSENKPLADRERAILCSQLCRRIFLEISSTEGELMFFLPPSPDVRSMGELDRFLDYADSLKTAGRASITVFARDAVGLCFASSLTAKRYKNITPIAGICGNGCGCPDEGDAEYWGIDRLTLRRASLSESPAFIGK